MKRAVIRVVFTTLGIALLTACVSSTSAPQAVRSQLAPTGTLRVGLGYNERVYVVTVPSAAECADRWPEWPRVVC